ncbi:MAG: hypothetical protein HY924_08630 [Elusimicrobia bacterium]|nr:hypothetical protein [Elusimicrobiota bacterium]
MGRKRHQKPDLIKEVGELSRVVNRTLRSASRSTELKELKAEVSESFKRVGGKILAAVAAAKESPKTRSLGAHFLKSVDAGKELGRERAEEIVRRVSESFRKGG